MNWLRRFMAGRYGPDQLSLALLVTGLILNLFTNLLLAPLSMLLLVFCAYRMLSRNFEKRRLENQRFLSFWYKIRNFFLRQKDKLRQSRDFRFFKCPSCRNTLRVPKGKGKIYVTCPKCGAQIQGKS